MRTTLGLIGIAGMLVARYGVQAMLLIGMVAFLFSMWRLFVSVERLRLDAFGAPYPMDDRRCKLWAWATALTGLVVVVSVVRLP